MTAFSMPGSGPVILFEGAISQETKDKIMTMIAAGGDISPLKSSGKTYYRFSDGADLRQFSAERSRPRVTSIDPGRKPDRRAGFESNS